MGTMSSTELLIADYLKRKGLTDTLKQLERDVGFNYSGDKQIINYEPLENIIDDRLKYLEHHTLNPNDHGGVNDKIENGHLFQAWQDPTVSEAHALLPLNNSLILHTSSGELLINDTKTRVLVITSNDKAVTFININTQKVIKEFTSLHGSASGKCAYVINGTDKFLSCGMDGKIKLFQYSNNKESPILLNEAQLHRRLIIDVKLWQNTPGETYIFSIGWDLQLKASKITDNTISIISNYKLLSNATAIEVSSHESKAPIIWLTRIDSTQLSIFAMKFERLFELSRISLNDAEFSSHGFTPMSISISHDSSQKISPSTLIALGTSHVPYMRIIIVKPPTIDLSGLKEGNEDTEIAPLEQHLASLSINRGCILANYNSLSPQDKYSASVIAWRLDASGIWINGDDGVLRGLDLKNGEIVQSLQKHEKRLKTLIVDEMDNGKEIIFTSSIDKKLNYWV